MHRPESIRKSQHVCNTCTKNIVSKCSEGLTVYMSDNFLQGEILGRSLSEVSDNITYNGVYLTTACVKQPLL